MDKIICDICGTVCPENAEACPICGYPCRDSARAAEGENAETVTAGLSEKGGRYSNRNVRRRHKAAAKAAAAIRYEETPNEPEETDEADEPEKNPNKPLLITIAILVVAIILVGAYIALRFFSARDDYKGSGLQNTTTTAPVETTTTVPTETTEPQVACVAISVDTPSITLSALGETGQLSVMLLPADTTDAVTFVSSDESVVTVTEDGLLTAVGQGSAQVTITCGAVTETCTVEVSIPEEITVPVTTTEPVSEELVLSHTDASLFAVNEAFTISVQQGGAYINRSDVTWTSSDPAVATVSKGVVTAVAPGTATITAEYNGQKASCIVRCNFQAETEPDQNTPTINKTDVTIAVGETFTLKLSGTDQSVVWTASAEGIVTISGNQITGAAAGTVTVSTTVDGVTYSCIVRVNEQ